MPTTAPVVPGSAQMVVVTVVVITKLDQILGFHVPVKHTYLLILKCWFHRTDVSQDIPEKPLLFSCFPAHFSSQHQRSPYAIGCSFIQVFYWAFAAFYSQGRELEIWKWNRLFPCLMEPLHNSRDRQKSHQINESRISCENAMQKIKWWCGEELGWWISILENVVREWPFERVSCELSCNETALPHPSSLWAFFQHVV